MAKSRFFKTVALVSAAFLPLTSFPSLATAQPQPETSKTVSSTFDKTLIAFEPKLPSPKKSGTKKASRLFAPPTDAPSTSRGGGRRDSTICAQDKPPLLGEKDKLPKSLTFFPVLPEPTNDQTLAGGFTISERPTFLVHIPKTSAYAGEFVIAEKLNKGGEKQVYKTRFQLPAETSGIMRFQVPETLSLEVGKQYVWYTAFACNPAAKGTPDPNDPLIRGVVSRVEASKLPSMDLSSRVTSLEQIREYGKAGIWYDAAAKLATLKKANSKDPSINQAWSDILYDVDLQEFSAQPMIN